MEENLPNQQINNLNPNLNPSNNPNNLTFPQVLHFLHNEWRKFEIEKNNFDLEKQELKNKISILEGEKKGFEILKGDLLKRIKMLEYALKQERGKYLLQSPTTGAGVNANGSGVNSGVTTGSNNVLNTSAISATSAGVSNISFNSVKFLTLNKKSKTREILTNYLKEVGYDTSAAANVPVVSVNTTKRENKSLHWETIFNEASSGSSGSDGKNDSSFAEEGNSFSNTVIFPSQQKKFKIKQQQLQQQASNFNSVGKKPPLVTPVTQTLPLTDELSSLSLLDQPNSPSTVTSSSSTSISLQPEKNWKPKLILRNHLDSVTSLTWHDSLLITGSEDETIKIWNLDGFDKLKKAPVDIEPIYTYRGHTGPITSIQSTTLIPALDQPSLAEYGVIYSCGYDGIIRCWALPSPSLPAYSKYEYKKFMLGEFKVSDDCLWDLKCHPISGGIVGLECDSLNVFGDLFEKGGVKREIKGDGLCCFEFVNVDLKQAVVGSIDGGLKVHDLETGDLVSSFSVDKTSEGMRVNKVVSHLTMPVLVSGHEDKCLRFWDMRVGDRKCVGEMVAHLDGVLSLDLKGDLIVSGGHDSSIRIWDWNSRACVQEFSSHRKKFDESVKSVLFHGKKDWLGSCGADGVVKVYWWC